MLLLCAGRAKLKEMTEQEHYRKTDECIAQFKNGKELYQKSALFNSIVQVLVRGQSPYEVIEMLIQQSEDNHNAMVQYIHRDTRPMVMSR